MTHKLLFLTFCGLSLFAQEPLPQSAAEPVPAVAAAKHLLTPEQRGVIQDVNNKAQSLQKEQADIQRAIAAEREVLNLRLDRVLKEACPAGETCQFALNDPDPAKWGVLVTPKPAPATGAKPGDAGQVEAKK